jgi:hypothetical protein
VLLLKGLLKSMVTLLALSIEFPWDTSSTCGLLPNFSLELYVSVVAFRLNTLQGSWDTCNHHWIWRIMHGHHCGI